MSKSIVPKEVPFDLAKAGKEIMGHLSQAAMHHQRTAEEAISAGEWLSKAKDAVKEDSTTSWGLWVNKNCVYPTGKSLSLQHADNFIRMFRRKDELIKGGITTIKESILFLRDPSRKGTRVRSRVKFTVEKKLICTAFKKIGLEDKILVVANAFASIGLDIYIIGD